MDRLAWEEIELLVKKGRRWKIKIEDWLWEQANEKDIGRKTNL